MGKHVADKNRLLFLFLGHFRGGDDGEGGPAPLVPAQDRAVQERQRPELPPQASLFVAQHCCFEKKGFSFFSWRWVHPDFGSSRKEKKKAMHDGIADGTEIYGGKEEEEEGKDLGLKSASLLLLFLLLLSFSFSSAHPFLVA